MGLFKRKPIDTSKYKLNLVKDPDDSRDLKLRSYTARFDLPKSVDLRKDMPAVFSQNDIGSCTSNGAVAAMEYLIKKKTGKKTILSRMFHYNKERMNDGVSLCEDAGSSVRQACKTLKKNGVCDEDLFTYGWHNFSVEPNEIACNNALKHCIKSYFRCETAAEIKYALAMGLPVLIGCEIYEDFYRTGANGRVPRINTKTECLGGHLMLLVGYKTSPVTKSTKYIIRNSWGESIREQGSWGYAFNNPSDSGWGERGYGYIDEKDLTNILLDAWCISELAENKE